MGCEGFWVSGRRLHYEGVNVAKNLFWTLRCGSALSWGQKEEPVLARLRHKAIPAEKRVTSVERKG